jgi:hypothetical protein
LPFAADPLPELVVGFHHVRLSLTTALLRNS